MDHTLLVILFIVIVGPILVGLLCTIVVLFISLVVAIITAIGKLIAKEQ